MEGNFKSTERLFASIQEDFSAFSQAQLLDEGMFYQDVKYILHKLGISWYRDAETIVEIEAFRGDLPEDFHLLDAAYSCEGNVVENSQPSGLVMQKVLFDQYASINPDWHDTSCCGAGCAQPDPQIFNRHELLYVQRGEELFQYHTPKLLKLGNIRTKRDHCTKNCANVFSNEADTITIQNKRLFTNFKKGHVFIRYNAFPIDEETGLPLIPDDPILEKCIAQYIKYNIMLRLWTNGQADVAHMIPTYEKLMEKSMNEAISLTKLPSFATMVNAIRLQRKRLNVYQLYPSPAIPQSRRAL